jgi:lipopolysaccharide transport protein LptA
VRKLPALGLLFVGIATAHLPAQSVAPASDAKTAEKNLPKPAAKTANKIPGLDQSLKVKEPVTTEVYSDEAFFDSTKYMGVFTGHVKVVDPRFNLQADKLTIYVRKGADQALEKVVAEGNVGVVRERREANGTEARTVGRADTAIYSAATGNLELKGTPRVQQGLNMQVATSPDTVMIINPDGQFTTHGPSRTDIHQEPKEGEKKPEPSPSR